MDYLILLSFYLESCGKR